MFTTILKRECRGHKKTNLRLTNLRPNQTGAQFLVKTIHPESVKLTLNSLFKRNYKFKEIK